MNNIGPCKNQVSSIDRSEFSFDPSQWSYADLAFRAHTEKCLELAQMRARAAEEYAQRLSSMFEEQIRLGQELRTELANAAVAVRGVRNTSELAPE
jgi:hypothetical protein